MNRYDRGFANPGTTAASRRPIPDRHGVPHPKHQHDPFGETGKHETLPDPKPTRRSWQIHANRLSVVFLLVGAAGGTASMITTGNWAAFLVLPLLLWFTSWIVLMLLAMVADVIRGV